MRIFVTSDWHVDASTAGVERLPELEQFVEQLTREVEGSGDLVLHLGDCWDPGTVRDPKWASFVYGSAHRLGAAARFGSVWIPGNHDVIDSAEPLSTLSALRALEAPHITVIEEPTLSPMINGELALLALPYVSRAFERTDRYRASFDRAFELALKATRSVPLIVITHLAFEGMVSGSESEMARGREVMFPVSEVEQLDPVAVLAGHYHKRQTIRRGGLDVHIVGAPIRFTFGEIDEAPRGYLELVI